MLLPAAVGTSENVSIARIVKMVDADITVRLEPCTKHAEQKVGGQMTLTPLKCNPAEGASFSKVAIHQA